MFNKRLLVHVFFLSSFYTSVASAQSPTLDNLSELSLTDLTNVVTSVSKRPEEAFTASAAIFVITQEDIKNSGLRTIPEILRMAPGLQVTQGDAGYWSITSRGFNSDGFGNKLLVLMDGRTVYTPLFSGVYWDVQDTFIEDIDRIEIIRGPGATLWGANAVNGVINIITKSAKETQTNVVSTGLGKETKGFIEARHGNNYKENIFYRVYGKRYDYDSSKTTTGGNGGQEGENYRSGFRVDWEKSASNNITLQGDIYEHREDLNLFIPGGAFLNSDLYETQGGNIMGRLDHRHQNDANSSVQVYFDKASTYNSLFYQDNYTFDIDYQYNINLNSKNSLITGGGYRFITDKIEGHDLISYSPTERDRSLFSAFIQDTYKIIPEKVHLTFGSKFEHNDFTGFEMQPSARIGWYPNEKNTLWASVSRAVRTPNRSEFDLSLVVAPGYVRWLGDRDFESEELVAYEVGYRFKPTDNLLFDATAFVNDYDNLRTLEDSAKPLPADTVFAQEFANKAKATSTGFELASNWTVTKNWKLKGSYTLLTMDITKDADSTSTSVETEGGISPRNQFSIHSQLYLPHSVEFSNSLYYVDELPASTVRVPAYWRLDSRIMWTPKPGLELSIVGQNLLDDRHQEFSQPLNGVANEIERNVYGKVTVRF